MSKDKKSIKEKNIKNYNQYLWGFIIINLSIFIAILLNKNFNYSNVAQISRNLNAKDGVLISASTIITIILNGLFPSNLKYIFVFWKVKNNLPGFRIFTELMKKDPRIDESVLIKNYGKLPTDPFEQNKLWYKIYKANEFHPMIFDSQRNFLLTRDLTGLSVLIFVIFAIGVIISSINLGTTLIYISFLLIQYIVLVVVCQNYGKRFTCNALALVCIKK